MSIYYVLGTVRVQRSRRHASCPFGVYSLVKEKHVCKFLWKEGVIIFYVLVMALWRRWKLNLLLND